MTSPWMRPLPPATRYVFQGDAAARAAVGAVWKVALSDVACRAAMMGSRAALWLGPDEYLLCETEPSTNEYASELAALQARHACSVVEVSHRQLAFEITGPWADTILSGACPLDLSAEQFPVGMCTRTVLAKAEVLLWRRDVQLFQLEVWRSFAPYVTAVLNEIAAGYGVS